MITRFKIFEGVKWYNKGKFGDSEKFQDDFWDLEQEYTVYKVHYNDWGNFVKFCKKNSILWNGGSPWPKEEEINKRFETSESYSYFFINNKTLRMSYLKDYQGGEEWIHKNYENYNIRLFSPTKYLKQE